MPWPLILIVLKYVETRPKRPRWVESSCSKFSNMALRVASKNWAIATRFIVIMAKRKLEPL